MDFKAVLLLQCAGVFVNVNSGVMGEVVCTKAGAYMTDPTDCMKYYHCSQTLIAVSLNCGPGTVWKPGGTVCVHAATYECTPTPAAADPTTTTPAPTTTTTAAPTTTTPAPTTTSTAAPTTTTPAPTTTTTAALTTTQAPTTTIITTTQATTTAPTTTTQVTTTTASTTTATPTTASTTMAPTTTTEATTTAPTTTVAAEATTTASTTVAATTPYQIIVPAVTVESGSRTVIETVSDGLKSCTALFGDDNGFWSNILDADPLTCSDFPRLGSLDILQEIRVNMACLTTVGAAAKVPFSINVTFTMNGLDSCFTKGNIFHKVSNDRYQVCNLSGESGRDGSSVCSYACQCVIEGDFCTLVLIQNIYKPSQGITFSVCDMGIAV